jgi:hypothetical protein
LSVSDRIRQIEREIDTRIRELPIWQESRAEVLGKLVRRYRDAIELSFVMALHAETFDSSPDDFGAALIQENRFRAGSLWSLKWASEYCPEVGVPTSQVPEDLTDLLFLGATYETFVDALKYAQRDLITVAVDETSRTIVFYEGGAATAFDSSIVRYQQITSPMVPHVSLTEDSDRLTSRWTAGDYRRVAKSLAERAAGEENTICVDPGLLAQIGKGEISIPQPTIIWLDRPATAPDCYVFDDLSCRRLMTT